MVSPLIQKRYFKSKLTHSFYVQKVSKNRNGLYFLKSYFSISFPNGGGKPVSVLNIPKSCVTVGSIDRNGLYFLKSYFSISFPNGGGKPVSVLNIPKSCVTVGSIEGTVKNHCTV